MMSPLISIVVPVYNYPELLFGTLNSVINQNYQNFELLIIDDGSTVNIKHVIESFHDNRLKYFRIEHQNANAARNHGITNCNGQFVAMLDADDIWLPNHLSDCLSSIGKSDGLYGGLIIDNIKNGDQSHFHVRDLNFNESMIDYLLTTGLGAQTSTLFLTANSVFDILWDQSLKRHQDYDFIIRYHKKYMLRSKKNITVIYRMNNKPANIDFDSCIRFIKRNEDDISPIVYYKYHLDMLLRARQGNASHTIIEYYKNEATKYIEYISYFKYLSIIEPNTRLEEIKSIINYLIKITRLLF